MKRLPKEKRNQLILALSIVALAVGGLWFGLIAPQQRALTALDGRKAEAKNKLTQMAAQIRTSQQIESQLGEATAELSKLEEGMAAGDLYSWAINMIRQFKANYKIDIPQFSQIDGPKDVNLIPKFPYKQATLTIGGTGYFHDIGKFVADFENEFPYMRLVNLVLEPAATPGDAERLSFKVEIVALVKPTKS